MSEIELGSVWVRKDCDLISAKVVGFAADRVVMIWHDGGCGTKAHCEIRKEDFLFVYKPKSPANVIYKVNTWGNPAEKPKHSHYRKDVTNYDTIDVYDVCKIFGIQDSSGCIQHALKKLLVTGGRGHKDRKTDLQNVIDTIERLIEIEGAK